MRQVVHKPIMWSLWLLILTAANFTASGQEPAKPEPPPAQLEKSTLPAAGRQTTILNVTRFGRYSILTSSKQGTALQLVDRMAGPGQVAGNAGQQDGRLDAFLERGQYQIVTYGDKRASGTVRLDLHPFAERNQPQPPQLMEFKLVEDQLNDFEQLSYWLDIEQTQNVILEAAGRNLVDLRLWKDGNWLVDAHPFTQVIAPKEGQPLLSCRLNLSLDPGLYLLTAYGGRGQAWSEDSKSHPFYLRKGIPRLSVAGRRRLVISPFGRDLYLVPGPANYFRLELPEALAAKLQVNWFDADRPFDDSGHLAEITKKSIPPVCELFVDAKENADHIVSITAGAGQPYVLQQFEIKYEYSFQGSKEYWISTIHSGYAADSVDATTVLTGYSTQPNARPELLQSQTIEVSAKDYWHRRVNLLNQTTLHMHIKDTGVYQLVCQGVEAQYLVEPLFAGRSAFYKTPQPRLCGATWDLEAGNYVMTIIPLQKGIADLLMRPKGLLDSILSSIGWGKSVPITPSRASTRYPRVLLNRDYSYTLYVNQQPGVRSGMILRSLPIDLTDPLYIAQEPGESVSVPFKVKENGTLRAEAEDGSLLEISADGGPWQTSIAVDTAAHTVTIRHSQKATVHYTLAVIPRRLDAQTALPPISEKALAALPKFPVMTDAAPQFGNLKRQQTATYLLRAEKPSLYLLQSTGLLATSGNLRSRTNPSFVRKSQNGVGRNFSLQQYLREGDYQITVQTEGESAGHYGLELARTAIRSGGFLTSRIPARTTLEPGQAIAYYFKITTPGEFHVRALGEGRTFHCRLEDKDGWPVLAPDIVADISQTFLPGQYRLLILPEATTARVVALIEPTTRQRKFKGHGPHSLPLAEKIHHTWMEPENDGPRTPDQWDFVAPAPFNADIELSGEMQGNLLKIEDSGAATKVAFVMPGRGWQGKLVMGKYRLEATSTRVNNRAPYQVAVWPTELVAGLSREVSVPTSVPLSVGITSLVELSSFGGDDVQARLYDSEGKLIDFNDDRPDDWNFQISRALPAGKYRLDIDRAGNVVAKTTVSMITPPEEEQPVLALPAQLKPVLKKSVKVFPIPVFSSRALLAASVDSNESVGLAIEAQREGVWQVLASQSNRSPRIQIPLGNSGAAAKYRLRLWSLDRREISIGLHVESIAPQTATEAQLLSGISIAPTKSPATTPTAVLIKLDHPGLFQADEDSAGICWSSDLQEPCLAARDKMIVAWKDELWASVSASQNAAAPPPLRARRYSLSPSTAGPLQVAMRNDAKIFCDLEADGGGAVLVLASTQHGQPAVQLVDRGQRQTFSLKNMAIASQGSASVLIGSRAPAALAWAATPESAGLDVRLSPYYYTSIESLPLPGNGDGKLEGIRASAIALAAGPKRVHLALGNATVAVLSKGNEIESVHWQGGGSFNVSIDGAADRLTLLHARQEEDRFAVEVIPLRAEEMLPPLTLGSPYERSHLRSGIETLTIPALSVGKDTRVTLHARGVAESVTFVGNDGQVLHGTDFAIPAGGGTLGINHGAGLLLCWLDQPGREAQGLWPAVPDLSKAESISLPSARKLKGTTETFQIKTDAPVLLHVRMAAPSVILLKRGSDEQFVEINGESTRMDAYLPAGTAQLCLRAVGGGTLSATAEFTASKVTAVSEGLGPEVLLAPGDSRLFSFEVKQAGMVGVGVHASSDVIESELLSSNGKSLGKGTVQKFDLKPGIYLLALQAPAQGVPVRAQAAVVGIVPPGTDPPEEVIRKYFGPEEAPPQFTSRRRAQAIESEEYTNESEEEGTDEGEPESTEQPDME